MSNSRSHMLPVVLLRGDGIGRLVNVHGVHRTRQIGHLSHWVARNKTGKVELGWHGLAA